MDKDRIIALQNKIIEGLAIAAQKLIENKKQNNQKMVVSIGGKIQIIEPK